VVHRRAHILLPKQVPLLTTLTNRYLAHIPGLRWMCLTNWMVARPIGLQQCDSIPRVSVDLPLRNEAGNIEQLVRRLPSMGAHTELIFCGGPFKDNTLDECRRIVASGLKQDITVFVQEGRGKGDAVRLGFAQATGDILMILDTDLSVAPEDLPQFYQRLSVVRGVHQRLEVGLHQGAQAMRFLNLVGNKFFALLLSRLLGQAIKDSLCGTKVLHRSDYERIAKDGPILATSIPLGTSICCSARRSRI